MDTGIVNGKRPMLSFRSTGSLMEKGQCLLSVNVVRLVRVVAVGAREVVIGVAVAAVAAVATRAVVRVLLRRLHDQLLGLLELLRDLGRQLHDQLPGRLLLVDSLVLELQLDLLTLVHQPLRLGDELVVRHAVLLLLDETEQLALPLVDVVERHGRQGALAHADVAAAQLLAQLLAALVALLQLLLQLLELGCHCSLLLVKGLNGSCGCLCVTEKRASIFSMQKGIIYRSV